MDQHRLFYGAILLLFFVSLSSSSRIANANISTSWINTPSSSPTILKNGTKFLFNPILSIGQRFACGFYCNHDDTQTACLLAVVIHNRTSFGNISVIFKPQLVWSANRNHPVKLNATLQLTLDGDLVLADADDTFVWSTNTGGKSVSGINLTEEGNLVLLDGSNKTVWQSFDHPTDSLLVGQTLVRGRKLVANISPSNWSQDNLKPSLSLSLPPCKQIGESEGEERRCLGRFAAGGATGEQEAPDGADDGGCGADPPR